MITNEGLCAHDRLASRGCSRGFVGQELNTRSVALSSALSERASRNCTWLGQAVQYSYLIYTSVVCVYTPYAERTLYLPLVS